MTFIIGVHCQDGIVLDADSLRTFGTLVEQEVSDKIEIVDGDVLIATSGEVGLSQLVKHELRGNWSAIKRQDSVSEARNMITTAMLQQIQTAASRAASFNREFDGCGSVIALPLLDRPLLLSYDTIANSREVTLDSPFDSIGSASFRQTRSWPSSSESYGMTLRLRIYQLAFLAYCGLSTMFPE